MISNNINLTATYLNNYRININKTLEKIENDGISYEGINGTINTIEKLRFNDELNFTNQFKNSIVSNFFINDQYDSILQEMNKEIKSFRELIIKRNKGSLKESDKIYIDEELNNIVNNIKILENTKIKDNEPLFGIKTESIIGKGIKAIRTQGEELIKIENKKISELLDEEVSMGNLRNIDKIFNKVNHSLAIIGTHRNSLESQMDLNEVKRVNTLKRFEKKIELEESIMELENLKNGYEAMSLMINKIKGLSLVNYLN